MKSEGVREEEDQGLEELEETGEELEGELLVVSSKQALGTPGFFEALMRFQHGETLEESEEGFREMQELATKGAEEE